jgi:transcriptional regulator with XRE-family HTH domain
LDNASRGRSRGLRGHLFARRLQPRKGLSHRELAKRIGTSTSAVCRLEDADYQGHSLSLLKRIAAALDSGIEIRFVPLKRTRTQ